MKKELPSLAIIVLNYNAGDFLRKCLESVVDSYFEDLKNRAGYRIDKLIVVDNNSTDGSKEFLREVSRNNAPAGLKYARFASEICGKAAKYAAFGGEIHRNNAPAGRNMPAGAGEINRNNTSSGLKQNVSFKVIFNNKNLGFAAGNNVGVREALRSRPDYILFLNPDTVVFPNVFSATIEFMEKHPEVGVASPRLELANGEMDEACHRGFPTPWRAFCHFFGLEKVFPRSKLFSGYTLGHLLNKTFPHKIDACSGAFMMVRREAGEKVSWWDEDYFWYGEDIDFCFRIKKAGYKIYFLPQVKIIHYRGVTSGIKKHSRALSEAKKTTRVKAALASAEAMRIFYRKHLLDKYPPLVNYSVLVAIKLLEKYRVWRIKREYG